MHQDSNHLKNNNNNNNYNASQIEVLEGIMRQTEIKAGLKLFLVQIIFKIKPPQSANNSYYYFI